MYLSFNICRTIGGAFSETLNAKQKKKSLNTGRAVIKHLTKQVKKNNNNSNFIINEYFKNQL